MYGAEHTAGGRGAPSISRLLWAISSILLVVHAAYYFPRVVDDLFISLRYAENFASGKGLVYNAGERVEGFSSPLWLLLQAGGIALGAEGVLWTKALGLASLSALMVGVHRFGREVVGLRTLTVFVPVLLLSADSYVVSWSMLGLETPAYLALLVWTPVFLRRAWDRPSRGASFALHVASIALVLARPEAPLFLAATACAEALVARARLRPILVWALTPASAFLALLVLRWGYFGLWLPHTFYAKVGEHFDVARVLPLIGEGMRPTEVALFLGGGALLLVFAPSRRTIVPIAVAGASLAFVASVEADWMPNHRHLLPVLLMIPFGWATLAERMLTGRTKGHIAVGLAALVLVAAGGAAMAQVDAQLSPREHENRGTWTLGKTAVSVSSAMLALRRREPPDVVAMAPWSMGMITQNFRILEASSLPLEQSWYLGRDIGKVGYYTGVRVFETDGLFTPEVVASKAWRQRREVDDDLFAAAFRQQPIAAELLDGWPSAASRDRQRLSDYDIVAGSMDDPIDLTLRVGPRPSGAEILRRYESSLARFPRLFYLQTLYGEGVSAAMVKRYAFVRRTLEDQGETLASEVPRTPDVGVRFGDDEVEEHGCSLMPERAAPGEELTVDCSFLALVRVDPSTQIFLHFENEGKDGRFLGDHPPLGGITPWVPKQRVRDVSHVTIPFDAPEGEYRLFFGLFHGDIRLLAQPAERTDGHDRVKGPIVHVARPAALTFNK